jgi:hypothetical protein
MEGRDMDCYAYTRFSQKKLVDMCKIISKEACVIVKDGKETSCEFSLRKV